jgi:hypothetical protein
MKRHVSSAIIDIFGTHVNARTFCMKTLSWRLFWAVFSPFSTKQIWTRYVQFVPVYIIIHRFEANVNRYINFFRDSNK